MRWLAIVNKQARGLRRARVRRRVLERVAQHVDCVQTTDAPGHATSIARTADSYDGIAVIGGDGTLFEVLAGMDPSRHRLALIPAGGGNSLARDLGIDGLHTGLSILAHGRPMPIDLMQVTVHSGRHRSQAYLAASTFAFGYVADVVMRARRLSSIGVAAYAIASMTTRPRPGPMRLIAEGTHTARHDLTGLIVSNTRHLANFLAFPAAAVDDGHLDVLEQSVGWARQVLHNATLLSGLGHYDPARRGQTRLLTVEPERPASLVLDGELLSSVATASVSCLPGAVTFQVPDG